VTNFQIEKLFLPATSEEKNCFQLLHDLDHVGGFVKGSITSKKICKIKYGQ
jgi:hypothetical protein